jgi:hypothetical protein
MRANALGNLNPSRIFASTSVALAVGLLALAGGTRVLTPDPAAAMIQVDDQCADAPYPTIDCEPTGGGAGGGGGGNVVPSGTPTRGLEVIRAESVLSPCQKDPLNCAQRQPGNPSHLGQDDGKPGGNGRHGGRPHRVAETNQPRWVEKCRDEISRDSAAVQKLRNFKKANPGVAYVWMSLQGELLDQRDALRAARNKPGLLQVPSLIKLQLKEVEIELAERAREGDEKESTNLYTVLNSLEIAAYDTDDAVVACRAKYE